jgi:hypothetical protein
MRIAPLLLLTACGGSLVRTDGVYTSGQLYLRFYADGTVISTATSADAKVNDLKAWFDRVNPDVSKGTWSIARNRITFHVSVDYSGFVEKGAQTLELGHERFRFVPW